MKVEIWSDIVCPWCYIGKRRFEAALARFPHAAHVEVVYRSFELDPTAKTEDGRRLDERLANKYGVSLEQARAMNARVTAAAAGEGLEYQLDLARPGNTLDAHRILHFAAAAGRQAEMKERLLAAYFSEGVAIGDRNQLVRLAGEAGLQTDEARRMLDSGEFEAEVRADEREAAQLGINGVPFFVLDRRYGVSGAQPLELMLQALGQAWQDAHPIQLIGGDGDLDCTDGSCAVPATENARLA